VRMPGKVKVRVVAGRGLPVMDRSADTTDAFAEVSWETRPTRQKSFVNP